MRAVLNQSTHILAVDGMAALHRNQTARDFLVQMFIQNPSIAAKQSLELRIKLGLAPLHEADATYYRDSWAKRQQQLHDAKQL